MCEKLEKRVVVQGLPDGSEVLVTMEKREVHQKGEGDRKRKPAKMVVPITDEDVKAVGVRLMTWGGGSE